MGKGSDNERGLRVLAGRLLAADGRALAHRCLSPGAGATAAVDQAHALLSPRKAHARVWPGELVVGLSIECPRSPTPSACGGELSPRSRRQEPASPRSSRHMVTCIDQLLATNDEDLDAEDAAALKDAKAAVSFAVAPPTGPRRGWKRRLSVDTAAVGNAKKRSRLSPLIVNTPAAPRFRAAACSYAAVPQCTAAGSPCADTPAAEVGMRVFPAAAAAESPDAHGEDTPAAQHCRRVFPMPPPPSLDERLAAALSNLVLRVAALEPTAKVACPAYLFELEDTEETEEDEEDEETDDGDQEEEEEECAGSPSVDVCIARASQQLSDAESCRMRRSTAEYAYPLSVQHAKVAPFDDDEAAAAAYSSEPRKSTRRAPTVPRRCEEGSCGSEPKKSLRRCPSSPRPRRRAANRFGVPRHCDAPASLLPAAAARSCRGGLVVGQLLLRKALAA